MPAVNDLWRRVEFWPFRDQGGALIGMLGQVREASAPPSVPDSTGPAASRPADGAAGPAPSDIRLRVVDRHGAGASATARTGSARGCRHQRRAHRGRAGNRQAAGGADDSPPGHPGVIIHWCRSTARPFPPRSSNAELFDSRLTVERERRSRKFPTGNAARSRLASGRGLRASDHRHPGPAPRSQARLADSLDGRVRLIATTAGDPRGRARIKQSPAGSLLLVERSGDSDSSSARSAARLAAAGPGFPGTHQPTHRLDLRRVHVRGLLSAPGVRLAWQSERARPRDRHGS